jgi:hypothetical protein
MCELRVIEDHMPPSSVVRNGKCFVKLMLRLQEGKDVNKS